MYFLGKLNFLSDSFDLQLTVDRNSEGILCIVKVYPKLTIPANSSSIKINNNFSRQFDSADSPSYRRVLEHFSAGGWRCAFPWAFPFTTSGSLSLTAGHGEESGKIQKVARGADDALGSPSSPPQWKLQ